MSGTKLLSVSVYEDTAQCSVFTINLPEHNKVPIG